MSPRSNKTLTTRQQIAYSTQNTSSIPTPNTAAIANASSRLGEYFAFSIATTVWRLTPMRSASSAWVISPVWNLSSRMRFATRVVALPLPISGGAPVVDADGERADDIREDDRREEQMARDDRVAPEIVADIADFARDLRDGVG